MVGSLTRAKGPARSLSGTERAARSVLHRRLAGAKRIEARRPWRSSTCVCALGAPNSAIIEGLLLGPAVRTSLARVREVIKVCPTPRRRSDLSPGAGSGASTASHNQTRPFASARRRTGGPGTSRVRCGAGFAKVAKVWFARGFARTCSPG
jgi:hypothetical protein